MPREQIERGFRHADPEWAAAAKRAVVAIAIRQRQLTSEDVLKRVEEQAFYTHDHRAVGEVMLWAARHGHIRSTPHYAQSTRPSRNGGPVRIWKSLIHQHEGDDL